VSSPPARHRKPSRPAAGQQQLAALAARARHRKPSALQGKPAKATAVTALAVSAAASAAVTQWPAGHPHAAPAEASATTGALSALGAAGPPPAGARPTGQAAAAIAIKQPVGIYRPALTVSAPHPPPQGKHHRPAATPSARPAPAAASPAATPAPAASPAASPPAAGASPSAYANPLRAVSGLVPERVDMGVDFGGTGPVYALGDAVITNATGVSPGWPGGGWITYRLTDGPDAGLMVYVAEDVRPDVAVGQTVTADTVIGTMYSGGDGIETGWAMADGASSESEMPQAGGIGGGGPFPTLVGLSFENLLHSVGVPASPSAGSSGYGALPAGYPAA
jgi:murein DD-endopeptidase MepM/ murein hydrolase activator NlpD